MTEVHICVNFQYEYKLCLYILEVSEKLPQGPSIHNSVDPLLCQLLYEGPGYEL